MATVTLLELVPKNKHNYVFLSTFIPLYESMYESMYESVYESMYESAYDPNLVIRYLLQD